ncbi:hypothetical protein GCM10022393_01550 [Aquimarina addita]|uniref:Uncharacterized protein n=1 Tax=Aquimarina addita TaxID=870485 RepID=A0ABP7X7T4_9FLAO
MDLTTEINTLYISIRVTTTYSLFVIVKDTVAISESFALSRSLLTSMEYEDYLR